MLVHYRANTATSSSAELEQRFYLEENSSETFVQEVVLPFLVSRYLKIINDAMITGSRDRCKADFIYHRSIDTQTSHSIIIHTHILISPIQPIPSRHHPHPPKVLLTPLLTLPKIPPFFTGSCTGVSARFIFFGSGSGAD